MDLERITDIAKQLCIAKRWGVPVFIDAGASAAVFRIDRGDKGAAALKIYDPKFFNGKNALIEENRCNLQRNLIAHGHPNLIEVLEIDELNEEGTWYLLMEFSPWSSLEKRLKFIPDDAIVHLVKQLAEAVLFLEGKGYVHRDIKPANIVVSDDYSTLKLLDLGVLRKISVEEGNGTDCAEDRRFIATAQYAPPEFLTREELPGAQGFAAINVYQVGGVLHDLIMKEPLFAAEMNTQNKYILYRAIVEKTPRVVSITVPPRLITLCRCALHKDPQVRVQSVGLQDFVADFDNIEDLRRRLTSTKQKPLTANPSLHIWQNQVRSWIGSAARMEKAALGAVTIKKSDVNGVVRWSLKFSNVEMLVYVDLRRADRKNLFLDVVSTGEPQLATTVVGIGPQGPDCVANEIPGLLASQLLYALNLSQTKAGLEREVLQ